MSGNSRSPRAGRGAAILRDSKLLLVKRKRPPETNHWVPGGKVDWLESVVAAVAR
jgi:ADP-ribose pyrophosphatase YjhB (NUDIX family)